MTTVKCEKQRSGSFTDTDDRELNLYSSSTTTSLVISYYLNFANCVVALE